MDSYSSNSAAISSWMRAIKDRVLSILAVSCTPAMPNNSVDARRVMIVIVTRSSTSVKAAGRPAPRELARGSPRSQLLVGRGSLSGRR